MGGILSSTPLDLVDLLFDFEGLEVIELGLVGLKLGVEFVLAGFFLLGTSGTSRNTIVTAQSPDPATHCFVALKQDNPSTLVTCCQVVPRVVELNGRYDVGWLEVSWVNLERCGGLLLPEAMSIPSVISSTSPLSPKHLPGELRQQRGYHKVRRSGGGGGGEQQPDPGLSTWQDAARGAEQRRGSERTG